MFRKKINLTSFVLEITRQCNHQCLYCYNVWKCPGQSYPKPPEMTTAQLKEIINKLSHETHIRYLAFSGGEPLLREDIFEIIDYCSFHGIRANLLTNGSLLNDAACRECLKAGVNIFEVPLLTVNEETHRRLTGRDDLPEVIQGMKHVKNRRGKLITVFVATQLNIRDLKETVELAIALGTDGMMFNRFNPGGEGIANMAELMPSVADIKEALAVYDQLVGYYGIKASVAVPIPKCLIDPAGYKHLRFGRCPSGNHKSYFTIDPFGNVRVCNHNPIIIGNLLNQDFYEIIKHPFIETFEHSFPAYCRNCRELKKCWGGCKAAAQVCTGELTQPDPFLKEHV